MMMHETYEHRTLEAVIPQFQETSQNLPGWTEENRKNVTIVDL
jgi:hypothetical protein